VKPGMDLHCQLVTTGNTDLKFIEDQAFSAYDFSLDTWNNSKRINLKVFGRYVGLWSTLSRIVYTQDDDCIVQVHQVLNAYEPGVVTCNLPAHRRPEYSDGIALVGWGCIFDRNLTSVFNLYLKHFPIDDLFLTECDRIFTGLNRVKLIDVPFTHLPNAESPDRLHKRPDHWDRLREIRERVYFVKRQEGMA
jgi:hypothetical protein